MKRVISVANTSGVSESIRSTNAYRTLLPISISRWIKCFPLFAGVIGTVGLATLGNSESFALYALQGFALLSLFGLGIAVRRHLSPWPFVLGVASLAALAGSLYGAFP